MGKEIKKVDLLIIGAGPAGLTAGIYSSRSNIDGIILEDAIVGGQVRNSYTIENYPGFKKVSGSELADLIQQQAISVGAKIDEFDIIESVSFCDKKKIIETASYTYEAKTVIIATGARPKKLPIPSEAKFLGKGIHYCAVCDGAMYKDEVIAVVGGGNSALEEAQFLSNLAKKVIIIRRHNYFNGEQKTVREVESNPKIEVMYNYDLVDVNGGDFMESAVIRNTVTGEKKEIALKAIFGYIGTEPKTDLFKDYINLDEQGYIITDQNMNTNIKGIFAAGDVRAKKYRQITTAVADGTVAALEAEKYIKEN